MIQTYTVDNATVDTLRKLSANVQSRQTVVATYLNNHENDQNESALTCPVFSAYQEMLVQTQMEYEAEKQKMFQATVPASVQGKVVRWNLDFGTGVLTTDLRDNS